MLERLAADTSVIIYLMAGIGILGILAKAVNQITLVRLVKAAGNMPKSTHKLIKLVRAKYEHACMIHDSVENIDAFVEKYIYEYRGCLFRIHTWRQIEILCVWFAGILAAIGAFLQFYLYSGFTESVYQYIAAGATEVVLLSVVMRLSDEPYKINAVKVYMVDYLENICAFRLKKQIQRERDFIDVISSEGNVKTASAQESKVAERASAGNEDRNSEGIKRPEGLAAEAENTGQPAPQKEAGLPINIEGEPRNASRGEAARQALRAAVERNTEGDDERPALREETIRQILEEFLA